jgi:hypothetical protein
MKNRTTTTIIKRIEHLLRTGLTVKEVAVHIDRTFFSTNAIIRDYTIGVNKLRAEGVL